LEACRLARSLAEHSVGSAPRVQALAALCHLQASRVRSRLSSAGEVLLIEEQDRSTWDQRLIQIGMHFLIEAGAGEILSPYHLLAGIAACHATAPSFEKTNWERILSCYDALAAIDPSPIVALNRAVALSFVEGPTKARQAARLLASALSNYYLYPATLADFYRREGDLAAAAKLYARALASTPTEPERKFIERRIEQCLSSVDAAGPPRKR
jgi:RNA polymerase sigma-70 factor (ECF subfamily)